MTWNWWTTASRRTRAVIVSVLVSIATAGVLSVLSDGGTPSPSAANAAAAQRPTPTTSPSLSEQPLHGLPSARDPDEYAAAVAELVLGMDPAEHPAEWYRQVLVDELDRDVLAEDFERLRAVTLSWVPDEATWRRQSDVEPQTSFEVRDVSEPDRRVFADKAPEGHEVRTVVGTQRVSYLTENGERAAHTQKRELSVWMFCPPDQPCSLVSVPREVLR